MNISEKGLGYIRDFENYLKDQPDGSCKAYQCQAGRWTCGWGCTEGVTATTHWTLEEAKARFAEETAKHVAAVNKAVKVPITQSQFDALVSFSYNCGTGSVGRLVVPLNAGNLRKTAERFANYNKYHDPKTGEIKVSRGLTRRRAEETAMFLEDEPGQSMPQVVAAPKTQITIKDAVTKVATPVAAAVTVAQQTLPVPDVPAVVTESVKNVEAWRGMGDQLWSLQHYAVKSPVTCLAVLSLLGMVWLGPRLKVWLTGVP